MSERKVLNKYYPPDFDPSKLQKLKLPKERQYTVRIMTPFNMKCNTCGDYIAKAKKFNARKETIQSESYLNLKIFRFYIRCPKCMAEITFKTNPKTCDYEMEYGAHRNFDALRLAELQEQAEIEREKEEEKLNPMKLLENRTKQSRDEMEELEKLAQLQEENANKQGVNVDALIEKVKDDKQQKSARELEEERIAREEKEDAETAKKWMQQALGGYSDSEDETEVEEKEQTKESKKLQFFASTSSASSSTGVLVDSPTSSKASLKRKLGNLVVVKKKKA